MNAISNSAIKALKRGEKYNLTIDLTDEVCARVFLSPRQDNRIRVRAYLLTKNPQARVTFISEVTTISQSLTVLPYDVRNVSQALLQKYIKVTAPPTAKSPSHTKAFADRVLSTPNIMDPANYLPYVKRGWGKTTTEQAVSYFANTIGQIYETHDGTATSADFAEWIEQQITHFYENRYKTPCTDEVAILNRRKDIYNGIMARLSQAQAVQRYLLDQHPEGNWPTLLIPVEARFKTVKAEEIKTITYRQYIQLCTIIKRLCEAEVQEAFAILLEVFCGTRIGESCAPLLGEMECWESWGRYFVENQVDDNGHRVPTLKRDSSYRYVVFALLSATW